MIQRKVGLACLVIAIAVLVAACGGSSGGGGTGSSGGGGGGSSSNGIASKPAAQILSETRSAAEGLKSVHIFGTLKQEGKTIGLDLHLSGASSGKGTMTIDGLSLNLVNLNGTFYMSAGKAFWTHFSNSAAAALLAGKWIKAPATGTFGAFEKFLNIHTLFNKAINTTHKLTVIKQHSLGGQQVVGLHDDVKGGTLYIAATGTPYPVEVTNTGTTAGVLHFGGFNQPVTITAPKGAVSLQQLESQASSSTS